MVMTTLLGIRFQRIATLPTKFLHRSRADDFVSLLGRKGAVRTAKYRGLRRPRREFSELLE